MKYKNLLIIRVTRVHYFLMIFMQQKVCINEKAIIYEAITTAKAKYDTFLWIKLKFVNQTIFLDKEKGNKVS
jgi:hypothetical protein